MIANRTRMIPTKRTAVLSLLLVAAADGASADAQTINLPLREEVFHQIQNQPVGNHTIEDYALPDEFIHRVADRIIRIQYQERFRMVYNDERDAKNANPPEVQGKQLARTPRRLWPFVVAGAALTCLGVISVRRYRRRRE